MTTTLAQLFVKLAQTELAKSMALHREDGQLEYNLAANRQSAIIRQVLEALIITPTFPEEARREIGILLIEATFLDGSLPDRPD